MLSATSASNAATLEIVRTAGVLIGDLFADLGDQNTLLLLYLFLNFFCCQGCTARNVRRSTNFGCCATDSAHVIIPEEGLSCISCREELSVEANASRSVRLGRLPIESWGFFLQKFLLLRRQ